jgi:hypothetical protein
MSKLALITAAASLAVAGATYATTPATPGLIHGCVNLRTGVLRIADECITRQGLLQEREIVWATGISATPTPAPSPSGSIPAPTLAGITALADLTAGTTGIPAATVTLSAPATTDVFINVSSNQPNLVNVPGGGVLILTGATTGDVIVNALSPGTSTLTAFLNGVTRQATITVVP